MYNFYLMNSQIYFGGGCFWCVEAIFIKIRGVLNVVPGYIGGNTENPTYKDICTGQTGHAEVIKITYNQSEISLKDLLEIFFSTHDPTTINRQGNDVGTQYRSSIFTNDKKEIEIIKKFIVTLDKKKVFKGKIVTTIENKLNFFKAEEYHQNYYELNKEAPYCSIVIAPKVKKLLKSGSKFVKN